jgi:RNA polymerase sigma factor (sigma-70 family)
MLNTWRDERRRDAHRASRVRPLTENRPASANSTEGRAAGKETLERVLAALESLPPRQKQVLHLAMIEELSISEIAEVLSSNRDAVKANLSLARKQMRELLGDLLNP